MTVVGIPQRQPPDGVRGVRAKPPDIGGKRVIHGVKWRQVGAEGDSCGACQGREIDEKIGRLLVGQRQRVGENEPPLGVRVADFNGETLVALIDIAWPEGIGGDRVLDDRDQHPQANGEPRLHDHRRQCQCGGGAAHIFFHEQHGGVGLDVEATRIETDALADESHFRGRFIAEAEIDQTRHFFGGAPDGVNERQIRFKQGFAACDPGLGMMLRGERQGGGFKRLRVHIVGGRIDEIAPENDTARDSLDPRGIDTVRNTQLRMIPAPFFVAVKAIGRQKPGERGKGRIMRAVGEAVEAGRQRRRQLARKQKIAGTGLDAFDCKEDSGDLAIWAGQDLRAAGFWLETAGARETLRGLRERLADSWPCLLGNEPDGHRGLGGFRPDQHGNS